MEMKQEVTVCAVKESKGEFEGRAFSSTTFFIEAELKGNGAGRAIGAATTPFKCGDAAEFEKWAHLGGSLPIKAEATYEVQTNGKGATELVMVAIRPLAHAGAKGGAVSRPVA